MEDGTPNLRRIENILLMMLSAQVIASETDLDELLEVSRWLDSIVTPI